MTTHVNHAQSTESILRNKTYKQNARFILKKRAEVINFWCYLTKWLANDKGKYSTQESFNKFKLNIILLLKIH